MRVLSTSLTVLISLSNLFKAQSQTTVDETIVNLISNNENDCFATLVELLYATDLVDALNDARSITLFAPIEEAFENIPERFLEDEYSEHLRSILLYHVLGSELFTGDLTENMPTLNGENVTVTSLDPPRINGVDIIQEDVNAFYGVIHVIDRVLLPSVATESIVDLAVATPELSTLVVLLQAAGLVDDLQGEGPFTVFAPTNDAFDKLDPADVDGFLVDILTYHVGSGIIILGTELVEGVTIQTLNGESLTITSLNPPIINQSPVIQADILASNGVIHLIDTVLLPSGFGGDDDDWYDDDWYDDDWESDDDADADDAYDDDSAEISNALAIICNLPIIGRLPIIC